MSTYTRTYLIITTIGLALLASGIVLNAQDSGGGANIGAGFLIMIGLLITATGGLLAVTQWRHDRKIKAQEF